MKEGDTCPACQTGMLENVRNYQSHVELRCNNPKCSNSHYGIHLSNSEKQRESSVVEHRDDHDQTIIREKLGGR